MYHKAKLILDDLSEVLDIDWQQEDTYIAAISQSIRKIELAKESEKQIQENKSFFILML